MILQSQAGLLQRQTLGAPVNPAGAFGEGLFSELNPRYYSLLKNNQVFSLGASYSNLFTYIGAAGGQPFIGLYNPLGSAVDLVLLQSRTAIHNTNAVATPSSLNFWSANQQGVPVTGTRTPARNMYSQANGGSAYGMVNVVNTGAAAATLIAPSISYSYNPTPNTKVGNLVDDINGTIVVAPGCYLAYGASLTPNTAFISGVLIWAEIPV